MRFGGRLGKVRRGSTKAAGARRPEALRPSGQLLWGPVVTAEKTCGRGRARAAQLARTATCILALVALCGVQGSLYGAIGTRWLCGVKCWLTATAPLSVLASPPCHEARSPTARTALLDPSPTRPLRPRSVPSRAKRTMQSAITWPAAVWRRG